MTKEYVFSKTLRVLYTLLAVLLVIMGIAGFPGPVILFPILYGPPILFLAYQKDILAAGESDNE